MKHLKLLCAILFFPVILFSQVLSYQTFDFPKPEKIKTDTLGVADTKAVVVCEKRGVEYAYNKDNEVERYYFLYRKVYIKNDPGIEENNKIYVAASNLSDILFFKARALSATNEVISEQFRSSLKLDDDKESGSYFKCAVEGLKKNTFVEYFYLTKAYLNFRGTEYLQTKQQKLRVDYEIISPLNLIFEAKLYNYNAAFKKTSDTTKNVIACTLYNIPEKSSETYAASDANLVRLEYKFAYNYAEDKTRRYTWESAGIRFYNILHDHLEPSKAIKKLIKENKISDKPLLDQVYFIEQFVKTNISTDEGSSFEAPDDILKNKIGSKTNILRLMLTYFRELNIKYEIYMVSNRLDAPLDKSFDTWNSLDAFMLYFPDLDKYLDPSNYALRLGQVVYTAAETNALNIKEIKIGETAKGLSTIKILPSSTYEKSVDLMVADISFTKDLAGVKLVYNRKISGYMADNVRPYYYYSNNEKRDEFIKNYIRQEDDNITVANIQVNNFDLATCLEDKPFELDYELTNKTILERAGDKMLLKVGDVIGRQAELYQEKKRISDIDINYPHQYKRTIRVTVPKGYKVANLSAATLNFKYTDDKGKDLMDFVSSAVQNNDVITITIDEHYAFTTLSKTRFEDFKKVINAAADFNKVVFVFEPI
jgi:hypothetical protein